MSHQSYYNQFYNVDYSQYASSGNMNGASSGGGGPNKPMLAQPMMEIPSSISTTLQTNVQTLQAALQYTFKTDRGVRAGQEALVHSSVIEIPEGNLKLARLGEAALKTNGIEALYLAGKASGSVVAAMESTRFTQKNIARISKELGLPNLIIVGGSKPSISDKMAAQVLQAGLGAIYIDGGTSALEPIALRLGL